MAAKPIFGRTKEIAYLLERIKTPGVTFVAGRPQMGKSRLIEEIRDSEWVRDNCLAGYHEASRGEYSLFRAALADLYKKWVQTASFREQGESLLKRHKDGLLAKVGGNTINALAELLRPIDPTGGTTRSVQSIFAGMGAVDKDLRTAGLEQPITYEDALDLLTILHEMTDKPVVLCMDAFDQCPKPAQEAALLQKILRHADDWPPCHIVLGVRDNVPIDDAYRAAESVRNESALAVLYHIDRFDVEDNTYHRQELLDYLREYVPVTSGLDDDALLALLDSYPGTLRRWRDRPPVSLDELNALKQQAEKSRYDELNDLFKTLIADKSPDLEPVLRLVLLPEFTSEESWQVLNLLFDDRFKQHLPYLRQSGILDHSENCYPSFGHTTRYEAARHWWLQNPNGRPFLKSALESLIEDLACRCDVENDSAEYFAFALSQLESLADPHVSSAHHLALRAVNTLFGWPGASGRFGSSYFDTPAGSRWLPRSAMLVGSALLNTLVDTKEEGDLERRDRLLEELRALAADHPEPAVLERLAKGLFNTLVDTKEEGDLERRDSLLEELRSLAADHPEPAVLEQLAKGLGSTFINAKEEGDFERRDRFAEELRGLAERHPDNAFLQELLELAEQILQE